MPILIIVRVFLLGVLTASFECPTGYFDENNPKASRVCRSIDGSGRWTCPNGITRLHYRPWCQLPPGSTRPHPTNPEFVETDPTHSRRVSHQPIYSRDHSLEPTIRGFVQNVESWTEPSNFTFHITSCFNHFPPTLLTSKKNIHDMSSVKNYHATYSRRKFLLDQHGSGDVILNSLEAQRMPIQLNISGRGNVLSSSAWNGTHTIPVDPKGPRSGGALVWTHPGKEIWQKACRHRILLRGPLYVVSNWFPGNFAHFLLDTIPVLLYVRRFRSNGSARFGLIDHRLHRSFLNWFDPSLADRIEWLPTNKLICLRTSPSVRHSFEASGQLVAVQYHPPKIGNVIGSASILELRNTALIRLVALETMKMHAAHDGNGNAAGSIIFYSRSSSGTLHGRTMTHDHEEQLLKIIENLLVELNRPEKLVVFNGEDETGKPLSFEAQFDLFSRASIVLGPHGAGLANLVWLKPSTIPFCNATKPAVVEFICTLETSSVQTGCPGKSYWSLLSGLPWVQYYHVFLAQNSTSAHGGLFVDLEEFEYAIREVIISRV